MPIDRAVPLTRERSAAVLAEALRRIDASIVDEVDLPALRQALDIEMERGTRSLVALMKVGRRRALDRIGRAVRKEDRRRARLASGAL